MIQNGNQEHVFLGFKLLSEDKADKKLPDLKDKF